MNITQIVRNPIDIEIMSFWRHIGEALLCSFKCHNHLVWEYYRTTTSRWKHSRWRDSNFRAKGGAILSEYVHTDSWFQKKKCNNSRWKVPQHKMTRANNVDLTEGTTFQANWTPGVASSRLAINHIALVATKAPCTAESKHVARQITTKGRQTRAWLSSSQHKLQKKLLVANSVASNTPLRYIHGKLFL